jgi:hypothetical protein
LQFHFFGKEDPSLDFISSFWDTRHNFSDKWEIRTVEASEDPSALAWWLPGRTLFLQAYRCNFGHFIEDASKVAFDRRLHPGRIDRIIYGDSDDHMRFGDEHVNSNWGYDMSPGASELAQPLSHGLEFEKLTQR